MKPTHPLLGLFCAVAIPAPAYSAVSVTLECVQVDNQGRPVESPYQGSHHIVEIDFDARTVRTHQLDANGDPLTIEGTPTQDVVWPAQIGENEVRWGNRIDIYVLGRSTGTLTNEGNYGANGWHTITSQCDRWSPPIRQKKF